MLAVWENVLFFEARTGVHTHTHTHTAFIHNIKMGVHILQMQIKWIIHTCRPEHTLIKALSHSSYTLVTLLYNCFMNVNLFLKGGKSTEKSVVTIWGQVGLVHHPSPAKPESKAKKINQICTKSWSSKDPWDVMRPSTLSSTNPNVAYREKCGKKRSPAPQIPPSICQIKRPHILNLLSLFLSISLEMKGTISNLSMNFWCSTCSLQLTTGKHLSRHKFTGQTCPCLVVNLTGGLKCENGRQTGPTKANSLAESELNGL